MTVSRLADRRFTVGGSEAAAACGVNPYDSRVALWARKTGRVPATAENEAMLWGKLIEPVILDVLENHGYSCWAGSEFRDDGRPWMVGHPDAFGREVCGDGSLFVVDAKTSGPWSAGAWDDDGAPVAYVMQLLHYMHLTGCDHGLLACLIGGQRLEVRTVERDDEAIAMMLRAEEEFVTYCRRDVPPPPRGSESDAAALRVMFPGEQGKSVRLSRQTLALVHEYRDRHRQLQAVKRQCDELKQSIQLAMGDAEVALSLSDEVAAKWTVYQREGKPARRFTA